MKFKHTVVLFLFSLPGPSLLAQTQIGGGTCSSSSLSGAYALTMTGRQVSSAGNFTGVFQANGSATFDGQSKVTITLTTDTLAAVGTAVAWSGTYSIQANCVSSMTISTGGSATFNLIVYNQGNAFQLTGSDSTYSYTGTGNVQPAACSVGTFSGVYTFSVTGFGLSSNSVNGVNDGTGLVQFDGQGNVSVNLTVAASGAAATATTFTGTYTISSACLGSIKLTDSKGNAAVMAVSAYSGSATSTTNFYVTLAEASKLELSGAAHAVFGQPTSTAMFSKTALRGGRS